MEGDIRAEVWWWVDIHDRRASPIGGPQPLPRSGTSLGPQSRPGALPRGSCGAGSGSSEPDQPCRRLSAWSTCTRHRRRCTLHIPGRSDERTTWVRGTGTLTVPQGHAPMPFPLSSICARMIRTTMSVVLVGSAAYNQNPTLERPDGHAAELDRSSDDQ